MAMREASPIAKGMVTAMKYSDMSKEQLQNTLNELKDKYENYKSRGLELNMARGILSKAQLEITKDMLNSLSSSEDCITESGIDCRNYGLLDGIPEAKNIFSDIMEVPEKNIIVCGNSSLNIMYDAMARAMLYGVSEDSEPWCRQGKIKFLCPVPGYDRHFAICESLGIEMINIPMTEEGPDMDMVESLVKEDSSIKGIWCVPKYSNPDGSVYSDNTIRRLAALDTKANDFRIFYDNAYIVHSIYDECAVQLNIFDEAKKYGKEDQIFMFVSTSKISFPGSGVAAIAASDSNIKMIKSVMTVQTIGYDKLNQLRHVRYFKNADGIRRHMKEHAAIIRPKFEAVDEILTKELDGLGIAKWSKPKGGYFISLDLIDGCAKRTCQLVSDAGIKLTPAGATFPYGKDPHDSNLRIAPTFPPIDELRTAAEVLCVCAKIACAEKLLAE